MRRLQRSAKRRQMPATSTITTVILSAPPLRFAASIKQSQIRCGCRTSRIACASARSGTSRGFGPTSLKNELASMRARLVVEGGDWNTMKGQGSFDNIDELFALGMSGARLGDLG